MLTDHMLMLEYSCVLWLDVHITITRELNMLLLMFSLTAVMVYCGF